MAMVVPEMMETSASAAAAEVSAEDPSKKIRKPYTITKSRESWTEQEHDKFLEALQLFDRDWKKIGAFIGSKTVIQIRSHAQKYFLKVQKNGTSEHVPPPRPKRKAAHPYPQKASKNVHHESQHATPFQTSLCTLEPGYALRSDTPSKLGKSNASGKLSSCASIQPNVSSQMTKEEVAPTGAMLNNCCSSSSTENAPTTGQSCETTDQVLDIPSHRAMPDFAQVYSFIGTVFDPSTCDHFHKLKEMDPIDVEAVLLLMRNLSINLGNPDSEDHRKILSSYNCLCG
ncbi:Transcription factor ASG4 [Apostasia shenzhenica]|uniref:Transcription factor ASG4 n=1 Tax=Apostasia shenzhenica TaxID=1088818 RepID=A0A2I0AY07_9ASPA|nr:Transcription factor ASG4 [Apostasia shenzhenica]